MENRTNQEEHDSAVQQIARIRFPFPDDEHPSWKTYINHPEQQMGIKTENGLIYPDIVVIDTEDNIVAVIGEVETEDSIDEEEAEQWEEYSEACETIYLYVPDGYCDDVTQLCEDNDIDISGFRSYYEGDDGFHVSDCEEE